MKLKAYPIPHLLDANKKGEKSTKSSTTLAATTFTTTVAINGNEYAVTGVVVRNVLNFPTNFTDRLPNDSEIVRMLRDMNYAGDVSN